MTSVASLIIDAFAFGSVLFIICVGLSITMGLMRVVNLAHGAFAMVGGYLASYAAISQGLGFTTSLLIAVAAVSVLALVLEPIFYRRIYAGHDLLQQILMTIGITFIIIGVVNLFFGPTIKIIPLPEILKSPIDLGFRTISYHRLFIIFAAFVLALVLWLFVEKTTFGIYLRASVDNADMAAALGIRTEYVYAGCFCLSSALAALGGVLGAELLPIEPHYALRYMVTFLVVVAVGGASSIGHILIASLMLGLVNTLGTYLIPNQGAFFFFLFVIALTLALPNGLGRART